MRILTIIALLFLVTTTLTSQTGTKLVYQTRYESADPKFHWPGRSGERTITYRLADRMRTEFEQAKHTFVSITRCDVSRIYALDLRSREYSEFLFPTPEEIARQQKQRHERAVSEGEPNYIFEVKITDTGETKQAFGHTARHYIKTTKTIPGPSFKRPRRRLPKTSGISIFCPQFALKKRSPMARVSIVVSAWWGQDTW